MNPNVGEGQEKHVEVRNRAVADDPWPDWRPQCIYFYYLKPVRNSRHADVAAFIVDKKFDLTEQNIDEVIDDLIRQARLPRYGYLNLASTSFQQIIWARRSYIVIVVDDNDYTLTRGNIYFREATHTIKHERAIRPLDGNISGVRYLNYLEKLNGRWNPDDKESEPFSLIISFETSSSQMGNNFSEADMFTHNDSGTNMGPPVPP